MSNCVGGKGRTGEGEDRRGDEGMYCISLTLRDSAERIQRMNSVYRNRTEAGYPQYRYV